jgi:hypothetical protein
MYTVPSSAWGSEEVPLESVKSVVADSSVQGLEVVALKLYVPLYCTPFRVMDFREAVEGMFSTLN